MDATLWITLILALLVSLAALFYVIGPLVAKQPPLLQVEDDRLSDLLARKDSALRAIKELEFDHQVGKIDAADYQRLNDRLRRQAITLLQQVEQITPMSASLDEQLEAEITQRRQAKPAPTSVKLVSAPVMPPVVTAAGATHFCTQCGVRLDTSFKFCANCGAPVTVPAGAAETTVSERVG
ncbi:MAG: zinc ribbon domain-containing protein [Caldilinea sp. CFX5]|nr:zinc ribbon domain-containing protein [Caldilinea sp. CFX5]